MSACTRLSPHCYAFTTQKDQNSSLECSWGAFFFSSSSSSLVDLLPGGWSSYLHLTPVCSLTAGTRGESLRGTVFLTKRTRENPGAGHPGFSSWEFLLISALSPRINDWLGVECVDLVSERLLTAAVVRSRVVRTLHFKATKVAVVHSNGTGERYDKFGFYLLPRCLLQAWQARTGDV